MMKKDQLVDRLTEGMTEDERRMTGACVLVWLPHMDRLHGSLFHLTPLCVALFFFLFFCFFPLFLLFLLSFLFRPCCCWSTRLLHSTTDMAIIRSQERNGAACFYPSRRIKIKSNRSHSPRCLVSWNEGKARNGFVKKKS